MSDEIIKFPSFLTEDTNTIHNRMLDSVPLHLSIVEGDFIWNNTRPSAIVLAEAKNLDLQYIIKQAFPQTAEKPYLDYLGEQVHVYRRQALKSKGVIRIYADLYTKIPAGTIFYTSSSINAKPVGFITLDEMIVLEEYSESRIEALVEGQIGNVEKNTITVAEVNITGLQKVNNEEATTGGIDEEEDDIYRLRIEAAENGSFVGNEADYIRWAQEIKGIGEVYVKSETPKEGHCTLYILDLNGDVANFTLLEEVQNHICPNPLLGDGLAPVNANIHIKAPGICFVDIKAKFIFDDNFNKEDILKELSKDIDDYLRTLKIEEYIIYKGIESLIGKYLLNKKGILDYTDLTINNTNDNIQLGIEVARLNKVEAI